MTEPTDQSSGVVARLEASDLKEFRKYFELMPMGNLERAWNWARHAVIREKDNDGKHITFPLIYKKWQEYLAYCAADNRPQRFIKSMESFLKAKDYNSNFFIETPPWLEKWGKGE